MIMFNLKIHLTILTAAATLLFTQGTLAATAMDSIGTGSAGSYSHGEPKGEGSKTKTMPHHLSGSKDHHISGSGEHHKPEGSGSQKSYPHSGKQGYSHKKSEGNEHHAKSSHGYSKGSSHSGHSSKCPFTHLLQFKDKLGLTEDQITEIKRLRFEYQKSSIRNRAEHEIAHMEFDKQVHAEKLDANAIRLAAGKIARTKTDKIMAMANAKIALLSLLTDEQRKKAHAMHSAHSSH
jgi:Spy/CpxP family protein refolding chaperone